MMVGMGVGLLFAPMKGEEMLDALSEKLQPQQRIPTARTQTQIQQPARQVAEPVPVTGQAEPDLAEEAEPTPTRPTRQSPGTPRRAKRGRRSGR